MSVLQSAYGRPTTSVKVVSISTLENFTFELPEQSLSQSRHRMVGSVTDAQQYFAHVFGSSVITHAP